MRKYQPQLWAVEKGNVKKEIWQFSKLD